jgi:hypothetical protein
MYVHIWFVGYELINEKCYCSTLRMMVYSKRKNQRHFFRSHFLPYHDAVCNLGEMCRERYFTFYYFLVFYTPEPTSLEA